MKHPIIKLLVVSFILTSMNINVPAQSNGDNSFMNATEEDMAWWREARFGIFIHWGPASILELPNGGWRREVVNKKLKGENRIMDSLPQEIVDGSFYKYKGGNKIPMEVYDNLFQIFDPYGFDAVEYVKMVKDAGAKYIVFTTKHHDGFCMFDSKYTDYDIMSTPFKRDICKELADECHKNDIKIIWYYSVADWSNPLYDHENPKPYEDFFYNQIEELCTNYGKISGFWWDGGHVAVNPERVYKMIKTLQPGAFTNGRMPEVSGDFSTPEQRIGTFNMDKPWESCQNMQVEGWYWRGDYELKSFKTCMRMMIDCAGGDGNLLLDFGPRPDGKINPPVKDIYLKMGKWMDNYGETIYGTRGGPYKPGHWGVSTRKDNKVFLHITQEWPNGELKLPPLGKKVLKSKALTGGKVVVLSNENELVINLESKYHHPVNTIIELELDGPAIDIKPIETLNTNNLTRDKYIKASSNHRKYSAESILEYSNVNTDKELEFGEDIESANKQAKKKKTHKKSEPSIDLSIIPKERYEEIYQSSWINKHRGHRYRYWNPTENDTTPWIEIDLGGKKTFNYTCLREKESRAREFELQYWDGKKWINYYEGGIIDIFTLHHDPVTTNKIKLVIKKSENGPPRLQMFDIYNEL